MMIRKLIFTKFKAIHLMIKRRAKDLITASTEHTPLTTLTISIRITLIEEVIIILPIMSNSILLFIQGQKRGPSREAFLRVLPKIIISMISSWTDVGGTLS